MGMPVPGPVGMHVCARFGFWCETVHLGTGYRGAEQFVSKVNTLTSLRHGRGEGAGHTAREANQPSVRSGWPTVSQCAL